MTDILIKPLDSNSRPVWEDACHKAESGDHIICADGIYNIEDLADYGSAVRTPGDVQFISQNLYGATLRRGDTSPKVKGSHAVFAPANFDVAGSISRNQYWYGFDVDCNWDGQGKVYQEFRGFFDVIGLADSKFDHIRVKNVCGDAWMVGQTYLDQNKRTQRPDNIRWADCYGNGKNRNRSIISFISATNCAVEGSCLFEESGLINDSRSTAAIDHEGDVALDYIGNVDVSGKFRLNSGDVWYQALVAGHKIKFCANNIETDNFNGANSMIIRAENGGECYVSPQSRRWDP